MNQIRAAATMKDTSEDHDLSVDYPIKFDCGCIVTFLASCFHRTTRMDCCRKHAKPGAYVTRSTLADQARREYKRGP